MKGFTVFAVAVLALVTTTELVAQEAQSARRPSFLSRRAASSRFGAGSASVRSTVPSAETAATSVQDDKPEDPKEAPALNWDAAPLDIVLQAYSEQTGKTILKDPGAPSATITLKTLEGQKLSKEEYLEAIEVVLEMNGVHLEPYGERFIRALPRKDVRKEGIPLIMDPTTKLGETGRVVSMMIPFKNISTEEAQKALEGFKSNSGILLVFERTNSILVTDTEQNINRMLEIARSIDIATPVTENVFVRQIKHANAAEIKTALEAIVQESQKEQEKSGKSVNAAAQTPRPTLLGRGLLARRNQPQQEPQPVNNASLVMSVSDADRGMIRGKVLILSDERSNKLIIVTQKTNMDFFDKVIEQLDIETTPDTVVKVYRLKYADSEEVSDMINDLIGNASSAKGGKENQNRNAKAGSGANLTSRSAAAQRTPANQRTGEAKAGELSKDNTTVLADKRINGLVVMTNKELVPVVESIIESMDVKLSQVLIETVIIEVGLGDGLETGIDWVNNMWTGKDPQLLGGGGGGTGAGTLSGLTGGTSDKTFSEWAEEAKSVLKNSGTYSSSSLTTEEIDKYIKAAKAYAGDNNVSPVGAGINYFIKSDKLNLSAVLKASKTDSRSKYIASPIIMTLDNKEATIDATEMRYLFKGYQYSGSTYNGSPVKDYEQKDLGIKIKVTPKINPNGAVLLEVEEEYSQEGAGQMVDDEIQATTITRKMSADALLEDGQTVIFGGLTQTLTTEKTGGIPFLKDIPWVGKWLFGYVSQAESRSELLVFMTPYVLDDAAAAQLEAKRRKNVLSDPRPWDDHGWSASEIADPVSQKEQLRRLKDEWAKQDAERQTRQAIEQEKLKRAKALEKMSAAEREAWLEAHKDELDAEKRAELEEKMLDEKSQDALRKLAEELRAEKLSDAEQAIKKAEENEKVK